MLAGSVLIFPTQFPALVPVKSLTEGSWHGMNLSGMSIVKCSLFFCVVLFHQLFGSRLRIYKTKSDLCCGFLVKVKSVFVSSKSFRDGASAARQLK